MIHPEKLVRRVMALLAFIIVLSALLIRLWGVGWDHLYARHHDEQIHLHTAITFSQGELSPRVIWLQSRYPKYVLYPWLSMYLVGGVIALYSLLGEFCELLLAYPGIIVGPMGVVSGGLELSQKALLIGRITVGVVGAATVWLLYLIGRRLWNPSIGLLSAAFLAFTGYHVANCHWLKNDVITVFFMTLALWFITGIFKRGGWRYYFCAPAACALAINCKFHVFPIVLVMIIAHCLRNGPGLKPAMKSLYNRKNLTALVVLVICLAASFPVIYLDYGFFRSNIITYLTTMPSAYLIEGGPQFSFWKIRLYNIVNFFRFSIMMEHGMGIYLTLLGAGGLILALIKRELRLFLIAAFPLIYLIAAVLGASPSIRLQDTVPLYPYAALLTAVFIYWVLNSIFKKRWLLNSIWAICGVVILSPYVLAMLRMDYGYWQPDTSIYATDWARRNIPSGSRVAREKKSLDLTPGIYSVATKRRLCDSSITEYRDQGFRYLVTSSRQVNRMTDKYGLYGPDHPFGEFYLSIESEYNLLKAFDLGVIPYKGGVIKIYELKQPFPLCPDGLNSNLLRCLGNDYSYESQTIIFPDKAGRCEGNTGFQVTPESRVDRLIISPSPLQEIGVQVVNGPGEGTIRISAGGKKISEDFQPFEIRQFILLPRTVFPFIQYSYRVKVSSAWNSPCLVRILTDPYRIGLGFLRVGDLDQAIKYLRQSSRLDPEDWLIYHQLAGAYKASGRMKEASAAKLKASQLLPDYMEIRSALSEREGWSEEIEELVGYAPAWIRSRLTLTREGEDLEMVPPDGNNGRRYYIPDLMLGPGRYYFTCALPALDVGSGAALVKITIRKDHQVIFSEELYRKDFRDGIFSMDLESSRPGTVFNVEIEELLPLDPGRIKVEFSPDLFDWFQRQIL